MSALLAQDSSILPQIDTHDCFAFALPASFSYAVSTSDLCRHIYGVVLDDDCIPRLSLGSMRRLQHRISNYLAFDEQGEQFYFYFLIF